MMQWERKQVEEEKAKLQNQLEVTRVMLCRAENRLAKAEHDRDRYKRRLDLLQAEMSEKQLQEERYEELLSDKSNVLKEELRKEYESVIFAYNNEIEYYKKLVKYLINKKEGN